MWLSKPLLALVNRFFNFWGFADHGVPVPGIALEFSVWNSLLLRFPIALQGFGISCGDIVNQTSEVLTDDQMLI